MPENEAIRCSLEGVKRICFASRARFSNGRAEAFGDVRRPAGKVMLAFIGCLPYFLK
jgi:hypothetical protein